MTRSSISLKGRALRSLLALCMLALGIALPIASPYLDATASAATRTNLSKADMSIGGLYSREDGDKYRDPKLPHWQMMSCAGSITRMALDEDLIQRATRVSDFSGLVADEDEGEAGDRLFGGWTLPSGGGLVSGPSRDGHDRTHYLRYLKANLNRNVQVMSWYQYAPPTASSTGSCGDENPGGGHFILIPVHSRDGSTNPDSADTWVACQFWTNENARNGKNNSGCNATRYTARSVAGLNQANDTMGRAEYWKTTISKNNGMAFMDAVVNDRFIVAGLSKPADPVISGNITSGRFVDAATITVTGFLGGAKLTETYVDPGWDARHIYFLTDSSNPTRKEKMSYDAKGGSPSDDPVNNASDRKGIPFITIGGQAPNISFTSRTATSDFSNGVNSTLIGNLQYYDYQTSGGIVCRGDCPSDGLPSPLNLNGSVARANATIWFYYSTADKAMVPVYPTGDSNEQTYIGTYTYDDAIKQYALAGPGCERISMVAPDARLDTPVTIPTTPAQKLITTATWTLLPPNTNCVATQGWDKLIRIQVSADPDGYKRAVAAQAAAAATLNSNLEVGKVTCDATIRSPITYIMCPIATAATSAVNSLDSIINQILTIDVNRYFGNDKVGKNLYSVWSSLRTIAMGIIVVTALIIVIAQASGWEVMSALTIRKALPNLVIAVILLGIWWPIGKALITFGDVATYGVRHLIYAPFGEVAVFKLDGMDGTGGTTAAFALLGTGYILALGIFATATLAVSAFIAVVIGCFILMLRVAVIIAFQTTSAFFIPFRAIPNMNNVWSFFWGGFTKAIWLGPVLAGSIAIARVLAGIFYTVSGATPGIDANNLPDLAVNMKYAFIIMAIFLYFGVYAILAEIVSAVGGLAATLAGRVNDRSRGIFDRMKNIRAKAPAERYKRFKHGEFFDDTWLTNARKDTLLGKFGAFGNRQGERLHLGAKNQFGFGAVGKAAYATALEAKGNERAKDETLRAIGMNDDEATQVFANSGGTEAGANAAFDDINRGRALAGMSLYTEADRSKIMAKIKPHLNRANAMAMNSFANQNKNRPVAAGDYLTFIRGAERLAEGDANLFNQILSKGAWERRSNGRTDVGGELTVFRDTAQALIDADKGIDRLGKDSETKLRNAYAIAGAIDGADRVNVGNIVGGHTNSVIGTAQAVHYLLDSHFDIGTTDSKGRNIGKDLKEKAGKLLIETQAALPQANGGAADEVVKMLRAEHIDFNSTVPTSAQIAARVDPTGRYITGDTISAHARIYDSSNQKPYEGSLDPRKMQTPES